MSAIASTRSMIPWVILFVFFGSVRQIKLAVRQLSGARKYIIGPSYHSANGDDAVGGLTFTQPAKLLHELVMFL